ncbi:F-box/kelch-repeat protein At3g06240-like [Silene latifolia]|uniref:F-box/kelch-repeat protein At3g06240-like n=1 Tax=Silene latifolia TaxID=37657 RepID=UPI003D76AF4F
METMNTEKKAKTLQTASENLSSIFLLSYMPPEILTQVFANLAVKTVVKFRCVCKSWCSIIDHPHFISMHLKHTSVNCDNNKNFLVVKGSVRDENTECFSTVLQANTLRKTSRIFKIPWLYGGFYIAGICDGLLLVKHHTRNLSLLNPCIRKSLILPKTPHPPNLPHTAMYIFGFAPNSNDYKVVAIEFGKGQADETTKIHVAVYTLSDQQWTVRNNKLNIDFPYVKRLLKGYSHKYKSNATYFKGEAHWLGKDQYQNSNQRKKSTHLISFNFDNEKFTISELPFASNERESSSALFLLGESLAIFSISSVRSNIRVLEKGEWTMWFSGNSSVDGYKLFRSNARVYSWKNVFYCETDGGGRLICGKNSYNIATCQVQKLSNSKSLFVEVEKYSESLLLFKGYGVKDLLSFP